MKERNTVLRKQEELHNSLRDNKKKIDFFEEYRKSPEFWGFFLCLGILKKCEFSILDLSQYFRHKKLKFFSLHNCKEIHLLSCKSFIFNLLWCFVTQSTVTSFASNSSLVYWLPKSL